MKSPEGFTPPPVELEKVEQEAAPKPPEHEIAFDDTQLEQYGENFATYIDQRADTFTSEAGQKISNSVQSMDVSPELLDSVKAEMNIDTQLEHVQSEVREISDVAKQEIYQTITETSTQTLTVSETGLLRAEQEVADLHQNPLENQVEDSRYSELSYSMQKDPEYLKLREKLDIAHKIRVFGTTDFTTIPLARFMDLCSSEANKFNLDKETEAEFRYVFKDKSALYDKREKTRVYRDPDGVINPALDPLFPKMIGGVRMRNKQLQDFSAMYPEKARGYAEQYPDLQTDTSQSESSLPAETQTPQAEIEDKPITTFEIPKVESQEEVVRKVSEMLKMITENESDLGVEALKEKQAGLAERPIIDANAFKEIEAALEEEATFSWVETDKIVGRPFDEQNPRGWSFEYSARVGRIVEVAQQLLMSEQDEKNIELVFHPKKPDERIKLSEIAGPNGPIYSVEDGTHRVAGAMTAGLREIPCDVKRVKYPLERITTSEDDVYDWQRKIELGLIQGKVDTLQNKEGKKYYKLVVQKEVLSWIRTTSQSEFIKISRLYEKMYPNSLDKLVVPRDALVDPIANNYYMAKRWKEWEAKFSNNPRDKNRLVIYS